MELKAIYDIAKRSTIINRDALVLYNPKQGIVISQPDPDLLLYSRIYSRPYDWTYAAPAQQIKEELGKLNGQLNKNIEIIANQVWIQEGTKIEGFLRGSHTIPTIPNNTNYERFAIPNAMIKLVGWHEETSDMVHIRGNRVIMQDGVTISYDKLPKTMHLDLPKRYLRALYQRRPVEQTTVTFQYDTTGSILRKEGDIVIVYTPIHKSHDTELPQEQGERSLVRLDITIMMAILNRARAMVVDDAVVKIEQHEDRLDISLEDTDGNTRGISYVRIQKDNRTQYEEEIQGCYDLRNMVKLLRYLHRMDKKQYVVLSQLPNGTLRFCTDNTVHAIEIPPRRLTSHTNSDTEQPIAHPQAS